MWSLHVLLVSAWVPSGYSGFPPLSKDMQIRLIGDSKLPAGVNVSVNGCLSLYVSPAMNRRLVQGVSCPRPVSVGISSSPSSPLTPTSPCTPAKDERVLIMDGWMDFSAVPIYTNLMPGTTHDHRQLTACDARLFSSHPRSAVLEDLSFCLCVFTGPPGKRGRMGRRGEPGK